MVLKFSKGPPAKRKPGFPAGLTRVQILEAAAAMIEDHGPDNFSFRALAKKLKVVPTTIHSRFKGGYGEIEREIARSVLGELTPPYEAQQDPKAYLRAVFVKALVAFRERPVLGRLAMHHAIDDPWLNMAFSERVLVTLAALSEGVDLAQAYNLALARLAGLILLETGKVACMPPHESRERLLTDISALAPAEFPSLKKAGALLADNLLKRSAPDYAEETAGQVVTALIAELQTPGR